MTSRPAALGAAVFWPALIAVAVILVGWKCVGLYRATVTLSESLAILEKPPGWTYGPSILATPALFAFRDGPPPANNAGLLLVTGPDCEPCAGLVSAWLKGAETLTRKPAIWIVSVGTDASSCEESRVGRDNGLVTATVREPALFPVVSGLTALPTALAFDPQGRIVAAVQGRASPAAVAATLERLRLEQTGALGEAAPTRPFIEFASPSVAIAQSR